MRRLTSTRKAFTLIELLFVIAIIALLVAILFAVAKPAREKASEANCISNLRQLGIAIQMYRQEYEGQDPGSPSAPLTAEQLGLPPTPIPLLIAIKNEGVFRCRSESYPPGQAPTISYAMGFLRGEEHDYPTPTFSEMVAHFGMRTPLLTDDWHGDLHRHFGNAFFDGNSVFLILCLDGSVQRRIMPDDTRKWLQREL